MTGPRHTKQAKQTKIDVFLNTENEKRSLVDEIMILADAVAEQRPDLLDDLVDQIIPDGWTPSPKN